ncbi:MAG: hypothetical protein QXF58_04960 [Desulfurococcaceae archaeon]
MKKCEVEKLIEKVLKMPGVSGCSVEGNTFKIFVESEDAGKSLILPMEAQAFKVEIIVSGQFTAL